MIWSMCTIQILQLPILLSLLPFHLAFPLPIISIPVSHPPPPLPLIQSLFLHLDYSPSCTGYLPLLIIFLLSFFKDVFEMQKGAITAGQKVLIVDDLIATGGKFDPTFLLEGAWLSKGKRGGGYTTIVSCYFAKDMFWPVVFYCSKLLVTRSFFFKSQRCKIDGQAICDFIRKI